LFVPLLQAGRRATIKKKLNWENDGGLERRKGKVRFSCRGEKKPERPKVGHKSG